jgi:hypothetical protein
MVAGAPPKKSNALLFGGIAALAAIAIVIALVATRGGGDKQSTVAVADAAVTPDPSKKRETDDGVPVRKPRVTDEEVPVRKPASNDPAECPAACAAAEHCGNYWDCENLCRGEPKRMLECLRQSAQDCAQGALCGTKLICDAAGSPVGVPVGVQSCAQTLACEGLCTRRVDVACGCRCVSRMDPRKILFAAKFHACLFRCKFDEACVGRECQVPYSACMMN